MRKFKIYLSLLIAFQLCVLSGCSFFKTNDDNYLDAENSDSLEIPPSMKKPNNQDIYTIPEEETNKQANDQQMVNRVEASNEFSIDDDIKSAWKRVGLALERIKSVSNINANASDYRYDVNYQTKKEQSALLSIVMKQNSDGKVIISIKGDGDSEIWQRKLSAELRARLS